MTKTVIMIPARLGSKRVKNKNLRYLGDKPLVAWAIEKAKKSKCKDIYLNAHEDIFKDIADEYDIKFYKRPKELTTDEATNDEFLYDFLMNVECDYVVQINTTSPFIKPNTVDRFIDSLKGKDVLHSVKEEQIECICENKPINFDPNIQMKPSQELEPVKVFVPGIMGFNRSSFLSNMAIYGTAMFGSEYDIVDYFSLKGEEIVDIDEEDDWRLAEAVLESKHIIPSYYGEVSFEVDVPNILERDGIDYFFENNKLINNINELINSHKEKSWSDRIVDTDSNSATLVCQQKGEGNRLHYHPNWNEWWLIVQGEWLFEIEGEEHTVRKNDVICIPKGKKHKITVISKKPGIRLAVSRGDVPHAYFK